MSNNGTNPPRRILLIDDDTCIRRSSALALLRSGYRVDATDNGATGWEALNENTYDLLITDNAIPKVSGVELLKKVRAARMTVPVIMATGTFPKEEFTRYPWLQPAATLPKPFSGDELLGTVKKVLRMSDSAREQIKPLPIWRRTVSRWFKTVATSVPRTEAD